MKNNLSKLIQGTLFCVIVILLAFTPIGYINLGILKVTTIHIPVIIASILLGARIGAITGFTFGLTSFINNTFISPSITSFVFTPFYENAFGKGNFWSLLICFLPRILIGITPYYFCVFMRKINFKNNVLTNSLAAIIGSLTNTILVMSMIYIFFGKNYASATNIDFIDLPKLLLTVIFTNGIAEIIAAVIITTIVCSSLKKSFIKF